MGLDSVELVMEIEKYFSISIPDQEVEKAFTVRSMVNCVAKYLQVNSYNFSLREKTFFLIKKEILQSCPDLSDFSIRTNVAESLNIENEELIKKIENNINIKLPGIYFKKAGKYDLLKKIKDWIQVDKIDFEKISWKKFIDITLAENLDKIVTPIQHKSKYEIYLAIMKITVDKIGVNYEEIGLEKSFTNDLGVD